MTGRLAVMATRAQSCRILLFAVLVGMLAVSACAGRQSYRDVPGLNFVTYETVGNVTYAVGRDASLDNHFYVQTRFRRQGDPDAMRTAVRNVYGCHSTRLLWMAPDRSSARLSGSFCESR